jgi:hypothetical protein
MFREQAQKVDARRNRISDIWEVLQQFKPVAESRLLDSRRRS